MTSQTSMLHVRIDDETKLQAQQALKSMGMSVSDAVRIFLTRVVAEQAIPFDVRVPNTTTVVAMNEADALIQAKKARFETVETCLMTSKKSAKDKRAVLPRSSDYTKEFLADWQRLSRSGRYDMASLNRS